MKSFMFLLCEIVLENATTSLIMAGPLPLLNTGGQTPGQISKTVSNARNTDLKNMPTKQYRKQGVSK